MAWRVDSSEAFVIADRGGFALWVVREMSREEHHES